MTPPRKTEPRPPAEAVDPAASPLEAIASSLRGLRYGQIVIQIHDGVVVQIERTEKLRPARR